MRNLFRLFDLRELVLKNGFAFVLLLIFACFSFYTDRFFNLTNFVNIAHAMAPIVVLASGLALVVMSGKLDISVGSIALCSATVAAIFMKELSVAPVLAFVAAILTGCILGAINGFAVAYLNMNPLVTTLGTMIAFRGIGLTLTQSTLIPLPEGVRVLGNLSVLGINVDIFIALAVVAGAWYLHRSTSFGRTLTAIGNDEHAAQSVGLAVRWRTFQSFVLSGALAAFGGVLTTVQVGGVTSHLGKGLEFTAVAVIVVGGISLFGGRGNILRGVLLGALTFEVIRNGLVHAGADPFFFRIVIGVVIFVAMYADSLQHRLHGLRRASASD